MVESLLEQKRPISAYGADHDLPATLTANQWALLEKTVTVLAPFEELTKQISSSTSSAAEVIPSVTVLKRLLARESQEDTGIKQWKLPFLRPSRNDSQPSRKTPCMQLQLSWIHVSKTGMYIKIFLHVHIDYCQCHIEYISSLMYFTWYCINSIFKNVLHLFNNYWCIKSVTTPRLRWRRLFICYIYLLFLIIVSFRYFSSADNIKHAKDALTVEMEKIEKSLKMTTTAVAETIAETPRKLHDWKCR